MGNLVKKLKSDYEEIMQKNSPEWAVHKKNFPDDLVKCTIPFVGKKFETQEMKILVYASAENLSGYYKGNDEAWKGDWLDNDEQAIDRHRWCFECDELQDDPFFPHVHLQPMNNGCLATAVYYIASKLCEVKEKTPREFYETIAFANYGKYSIETELQRNKRLKGSAVGSKTNIDYADDRELLEASHDFIAADINALEPDYIIMPKSIYNADRKFIDSVKGDAVVIGIYQMNAQAINLHIAPKFTKYDKKDLCDVVSTWYEALGKDSMTGENKENYLAVFSHLDNEIEKIGR